MPRAGRNAFLAFRGHCEVSFVGILFSFLFMLAQCAGAPAAKQSPVIDQAVRIAAAGGRARVIVELRITPDFKPEGELRDPAAVEAQRGVIAKVQADLLSRLHGTNFALARQYDSVPLLALEIDADALARLEAAGDLVARVMPERRLSPQK